MNLIYIHGLDSDANSTKGVLLDEYCQKHHLDISAHRPDLNQPPKVVFDKLLKLVAELDADSKVILVGSSLGGYFATLVSNETGCPALLINPSTQPHITLQRFEADKSADTLKIDDHQKRYYILPRVAGQLLKVTYNGLSVINYLLWKIQAK